MYNPEKCGECHCSRRYDKGPFERDPHTCCELLWFLFELDYRVDPGSIDTMCPFKSKKFKDAANEIGQVFFS